MKNKAIDNEIMALRHTIAWMDLVMANVNESILVLDADWRIIFANSYMAEILGSDRVQLLGRALWDVLPMINEKNKLQIQDLPLKLIASLNAVYDLKYKRITRKLQLQGKYVHAISQAVCILSDVTIELKAENALMSLQNEVSNLKH